MHPSDEPITGSNCDLSSPLSTSVFSEMRIPGTLTEPKTPSSSFSSKPTESSSLSLDNMAIVTPCFLSGSSTYSSSSSSFMVISKVSSSRGPGALQGRGQVGGALAPGQGGAWHTGCSGGSVVLLDRQFIGHGIFEKRAPALLDNLAQAFLMAPYFVFLELGINAATDDTTVQDPRDELVLRLSYLFSNESSFAERGSTQWFSSNFCPCVYDTKFSSLCKSINPKVESNPLLIMSLMLKAASRLSGFVSASKEQLSMKRENPYPPKIVQSVVDQQSSLLDSILIKVVQISYLVEKTVEPLTLNVASNGYYLDIIAQELGLTDASKVLVSSFWNFDALFQPQQHPARDSHDTFFLQVPPMTKFLPEDYVERVKRVHEFGGYVSRGYEYDWKREEANKNLLRTHTTAVSSRMLYQLAQFLWPWVWRQETSTT
ncbi:Phenylalanine--tRNA ligase alpha subunit, cytoplasmic [Camellia lanceoleosa]|uniref:Phenylalanine--tRNA ligase alpha subunit, cytoplasmic n=1 Tax=Camellia lanceoleosa TaxID=1840588 RepID=A0ACC0ID24_9ERIC|nr:Phenylalanine--tRNA ligase alpha subunit, cytoplasmic [Camellia lanceoleosa]